MHRADSVPRFWKEFSLASDPNPSIRRRLASNFLRAFTVLYFFLLIRFGVLVRGYQDPPGHGDAFVYWDKRLGVKRCLSGRGRAGFVGLPAFRNCSVPLQHPCANRLFPPSGPPSRRDPGVDRTNAGTFLRLSLPLFRALLSTTFVRPPACDRRRSSRILVGRAFLYRPPARDAHHRCSFHLSEQTFERYLK